MTQDDPQHHAPFPTGSYVPIANPGLDFYRNLRSATPRVWVTWVLLGLNVAVFAAMVASGVSLINPTSAQLVRWGADYAPLTNNGQPWRLLTSMFVHGGLLHIAFNMYVMYAVGPFVERLFGNVPFLVLYLLSGLIGSLASDWWNPAVASVGASGAIFGVYGGLIGYLLVQRATVPQVVLAPLAKSAAIFVVYNIFFGLSQRGIDMAAHLGGLAGGFVCGLLLARPLGEAGVRTRLARALVVAVGLGVVLGAAVSRLPKVLDVDALIDRFSVADAAALKTYNGAADALQHGNLTPEQFVDVVRNQVLPPFDAQRAQLHQVAHLPKAMQARVDLIARYADKRAEQWRLAAEAVKGDDEKAMERSRAAGNEAEGVLKQLAGDK